jgi:hypothetical protein
MLDDLILKLAEFRHDPLGYVRWAFPWGEPGELENEKLRAWQEDFLGEIGELLRADPFEPIRMSRATGHGVGKSALVGMITDWAFNTCVDTRGVITANTENQLKTKTWVEIAKWHRLSIARELAILRATSLRSADPLHEDTWRIDVVPWSENNTEAFAGLHNKRKRIFLVKDEASAIHDSIYEVTEGALTDEETEILYFLFCNPTRNRGRFRDTAPDGKFGKRWRFRSLDSRTVEGTNLKQIKEWEQDYGEDSDFFKVRVRGLFPDADGDSFIGRTDAVAATQRQLPDDASGDIVLGVDVARSGGDLSVIYPRRGRDARSLKPIVYAGLDTVQLSWMVRDAILEHHPAAVFVDETGIGAGVVDNLRNMQLSTLIIGVNFGSGADGYAQAECLNKRMEIWWLMREWLQQGGCIPEHLPAVERTFIEELCAPTYGFAGKVKGRSDALQLQSKKDIKRENGWSTDFGDALAMTFAMPLVAQRTLPAPAQKPSVSPDYHPLEVSW